MSNAPPSDPRILPRGPPRAPALPVAAAIGIGIALDRWMSPGLILWCLLSGLALAAWISWRDQLPRLSVGMLLISCAGLGAAWHHWQWSTVRNDHLAAIARESPAPVKVIATIRDSPVVVPPRDNQLSGGAPKLDRTLCTLDCTAIEANSEFLPVSGIARLEVLGHLPGVGIGDRVEVVGRVSRPGGAQNPGGFDFRAYLRASGIHAVIRCGEPEGVNVLQPGRDPRRRLARVRAEAERLLTANLSRDTAPVGVAMLLGTRTTMPEEVRDAFRKSGTLHVLAISGLHVAILAGLVLVVCRALNAGRRWSLATVLAVILFYAALTDAQPSVVRAVLMLGVVVAGQLWFRGGSMLNTLAVAAIGVLAWNPSHLFDTGAQLSFLAVAGLIWAPSWQRPVPVDAAADPLSVAALVKNALGWLWAGLEATGAVWLFTLPLTMSTFHLFSPVGFLINVALGPLSMIVLWCGYLLLFLGLVAPPLAVPFGWGFDAGLRGLLWLVETSVSVPGGYIPVSGPHPWWLAGFYLGIAALLVAARGTRPAHLTYRGLLGWTVLGLGVGLWPAAHSGLRCTFLSVGHGVAVLVELPGGRTLMYDAGQLQDSERAEQIVQSVLWSRGRTFVDALVVSHADVDHFNAVPGLAEEAVVRQVWLHPTFLDFDQDAVVSFCERCAARRVPLQFVWGGDRLQLDPTVAIEVVQPRATDRWREDNANSVVLRIEYAGRSILLTGDLESSGLVALLASPRRPVDVLLSPHHGSRAANTPQLAAWSAPALVVVSSGYDGTEERLRAMYETAAVWSTRERGAVEVTIDPQGEISWKHFRNESR